MMCNSRYSCCYTIFCMHLWRTFNCWYHFAAYDFPATQTLLFCLFVCLLLVSWLLWMLFLLFTRWFLKLLTFHFVFIERPCSWKFMVAICVNKFVQNERSRLFGKVILYYIIFARFANEIMIIISGGVNVKNNISVIWRIVATIKTFWFFLPINCYQEKKSILANLNCLCTSRMLNSKRSTHWLWLIFVEQTTFLCGFVASVWLRQMK